MRERDRRTGKSVLPWFEHVFYERGTRLSNFYVRGMSLSGPSWSLLDTGQHLQIKGNVEFDRYTLHSYDYLNFIPFWIANAGGGRVDMPGAELLDELGIPLLADAYPYDERFVSFQLYQRGNRWTTLQRGLKNAVSSRGLRDFIDEWNTVGVGGRDILNAQQERELMEKLRDPRVRYLDFYTTDFDHAAHHNRDRATQLAALKELDALVGRIWAAIQETPQAAETALVVVSDHGTNTDERVYSQGYNLVKLLGSAGGGGHHVVTKRRLLNDYALKGIYPLIPLIYTTTEESFYLKGRSTTYPTALVDFDGNERASVHLRDSDLNLLHILLLELRRDRLPEPLRRAARDAFFATLERRRPRWRRTFEELRAELGALRKLIERQRQIVESQPKKFTQADRDAGRDKEARRHFARLDSWEADERKYAAYARQLANLLALDPARFQPSRVRAEDLFAPGAMGDANTIHGLQNYVVGPAAGGLALGPGGALDMEQSFRRVNYFDLLGRLSVINNVQPGVASRPVDFVAVRVPAEAVREALGEDLRADEVIWLYGGRERQALILARTEGALRLRYLPVSDLRQGADGRVRLGRAAWGPGLPLKLWEDARLSLPNGTDREGWLSGWHTDLEWLRAAHRTQYSNAVVGLHEQLGRHPTEAADDTSPGLAEDERLLRRFRRRQRELVETDLLIFANDHWNFDVRGFNPGGNHGSLFRVSAHSTLMLAGGDRTGVPRGLAVEEPYDSLSFMPTLLALTGQLEDGTTRPVPALWRMGYRRFPGRLIREIFEAREERPAPVAANTPAEAAP
ncbi:MAG TPA: alkaline phosphatase family protein [Pyrinomonadaceae bacterium]|nr:alkaline phosphatase family protein [Pyrinomonadaceae bacterium]